MHDETLISQEAMVDALVGVFELSPTAMCISTAGLVSRYVKVNAAYLALTGLVWEDIRDRDIVASGASVEDAARRRRRHLLETEGRYVLEELDLRHVSGRIVPTLVSAQRRTIGDVVVDIEIIQDNSERKRLQLVHDAELRAAALTDSLTGLPNRLHFDGHLEERLADREGTGVATLLAFVDLNGFKAVNDGHGHAIGDCVLATLARRLASWARSRPHTFVARLGGDEFAIVMPAGRSGLAGAKAHVARLAGQVFAPVAVQGLSLHLGAAVGIVLAPPGGMASTAMRHADQLMYAAKAAGGHVRIQWAPDGPEPASLAEVPRRRAGAGVTAT